VEKAVMHKQLWVRIDMGKLGWPRSTPPQIRVVEEDRE
jgi:hypothetical protein